MFKRAFRVCLFPHCSACRQQGVIYAIRNFQNVIDLKVERAHTLSESDITGDCLRELTCSGELDGFLRYLCWAIIDV